MRRDGVSVFVPFPRQLMSLARSGVTMGAEFAREVLNMYATADGAGSKRNGLVAVGDMLPDGARVVGVFGYVKAGSGFQLLAAGDNGCLYVRMPDDSWLEVYSGLDVRGVVRSVTFAGRLLVVNGVDPMLAWDGDTFEVVEEYVPDVASGLAYVNATTFFIASEGALYGVGLKVKATLSTGDVVANVASVAEVAGGINVTLDAAVLNTTISAVAYTVRPPIMAYVCAAHDRLWGFGKGPLGSGLPNDVDRTRVYYSFGVNNHTAWADTLGVVPSINLADKSSGADALMAMVVADGVTVFLLRHSVQVWVGQTPGVSGDFAWQKTIPVGCVHGSLVLALPNDVAFVSANGVRTLSRSLITEQVAVSDVGSEIDPLLADELRAVMANDALYARVGTVVNVPQNWFGICLPDKTLVFQVGASGRGWSVFDGGFAGICASCVGADGNLYVGKGGQVYRYDPDVWSEDGVPYTTRWWTPWLRFAKAGKRWANRYVELMRERGVPMELVLRRYRNLDDGDGWVSVLPAMNNPDYWDSADWDVGFWDNANPSPDAIRDRFVADEVAFAVESQNTLGPLTLLGLKVFGVGER